MESKVDLELKMNAYYQTVYYERITIYIYRKFKMNLIVLSIILTISIIYFNKQPLILLPKYSYL